MLVQRVPFPKVDSRSSSLEETNSSQIQEVNHFDAKDRPLRVQNVAKTYEPGNFLHPWDEKLTGIPQYSLDHNLKLHAPFEVSLNGQWFVGTVYPKRVGMPLISKQLAIFSRPEKKLITLLDLNHNIGALSWSPSGNTLAILMEEDVTEDAPWSLNRALASLIGKPIPFTTLWVFFYDNHGTLQCKQRFRETVAYGSGALEWDDGGAEEKRTN